MSPEPGGPPGIGDGPDGTAAPDPRPVPAGPDDEGRPTDAVGGVSGDAPRLVLTPTLRDEMARELEAAYPREGCGVLLGRVRAEERVVTRVERAPNRWPDRDDRYLVDPTTLRRLSQEEAEGGPRILGFYHSHPDAAPVPSETDRELAWPWYLYLVVPVADGVAGEGRAWELDPGDDGFVEREVRVGDDDRAAPD